MSYVSFNLPKEGSIFGLFIVVSPSYAMTSHAVKGMLDISSDSRRLNFKLLIFFGFSNKI